MQWENGLNLSGIKGKPKLPTEMQSKPRPSFSWRVCAAFRVLCSDVVLFSVCLRLFLGPKPFHSDMAAAGRLAGWVTAAKLLDRIRATYTSCTGNGSWPASCSVASNLYMCVQAIS